MKVAIATNDRKEIAHRTGRAKEFAIYTITDSKISDIEFKENLHHHHHNDEHRHGHRRSHGIGHHHEHGEGEHHHDEVVEALEGVDWLLYKALGKYMRKDMEEANIKLKRTNFVTLGEIVDEFIKEL